MFRITIYWSTYVSVKPFHVDHKWCVSYCVELCFQVTQLALWLCKNECFLYSDVCVLQCISSHWMRVIRRRSWTVNLNSRGKPLLKLLYSNRTSLLEQLLVAQQSGRLVGQHIPVLCFSRDIWLFTMFIIIYWNYLDILAGWCLNASRFSATFHWCILDSARQIMYACIEVLINSYFTCAKFHFTSHLLAVSVYQHMLNFVTVLTFKKCLK